MFDKVFYFLYRGHVQDINFNDLTGRQQTMFKHLLDAKNLYNEISDIKVSDDDVHLYQGQFSTLGSMIHTRDRLDRSIKHILRYLTNKFDTALEYPNQDKSNMDKSIKRKKDLDKMINEQVNYINRYVLI